MEQTVEVRYAGVVVGRTDEVRDLDGGGLFLALAEPLPVGAAVTLKVGERQVAAKVESVAESADLSLAGMRVRLADASAVSLFGTPTSPASPAPSAPAPPRAAEVAPPVAPAAAPAAAAPQAPVADDAAAPAGGADEAGGDAADGGDGAGEADERLPAPDPSALGGRPAAGGGGGRRGRRGKRR